MNYLHNLSNHDPFAYSFRECASFDFRYMHNELNETKKFTTDIVDKIKIIHDKQKKDKKWFWQKINKPKFGNHFLSYNRDNFLCIDNNQIVFDHQFLAWIIGYYNFDLYDEYKEIFDLANNKFQEMYDDIKNNYEFYCNVKENIGGYSIEKYNVFFLTLKTGLYFTSPNCPSYYSQDFYSFKMKGVFNETYLLSETIINNEIGSSFDYAHKKYDEYYNDKLSKIALEGVLKIVNSLPR